MSVLTDPGWGGWALDRHTGEELAGYLDRVQPRTVVEFGSGMSTILLAEYASRTGASVTSVEHLKRYGDNTHAALAARGLGGYVDLRVRSLTGITTPAGVLPWYGAGLPTNIDLALVDGPPGKIGRHAALFALHPLLNPDGWQVWLDDADRPGEQDCLALWAAHFPALHFRPVPTPKGLTVITPAPVPAGTVEAGDVAVTLLTGGRPDLLAATVASVLRGAPGLLETAHVAVLHNGPDPATAALIDSWGWVDHLTVLEDRLPVAQAALALLGFPPPRQYTLHLEDDWQVATLDLSWLDRARAVLADEPDVGQVRLRHRGEPVLKTHMVTRRPITWSPGLHGTEVASAHYTLNPSLMRSAQVAELWPAPDERGAARQMAWRGWTTAQMVPGVFRHIGGGASLRRGER